MAEQVSERPILDQIFDLLKDSKQPQTFYDVMKMVKADKLAGEDRADYYARVYTNLNLDGRFLSLGNNFWGLKSWYPIDQRDEDVASKLAPKRKRKPSEDDDDLDEALDDFDDLEDYDDDLDDDIFDEDNDDDEVVGDEEFSDDDDDDDEDFDDDDEDLDDDYNDDEEED